MGFSGDTQRSSGLTRMFSAIAADASGATAAALEATRKSAAGCFAQQRDPAGRSWAALAASTLRQREAGPILGSLADSLSFVEVAVGRWAVRSSKPYAGFHLGPDATHNRPARPYLPVDPESAAAVSQEVRAALSGWLQGHREGAGL